MLENPSVLEDEQPNPGTEVKPRARFFDFDDLAPSEEDITSSPTEAPENHDGPLPGTPDEAPEATHVEPQAPAPSTPAFHSFDEFELAPEAPSTAMETLPAPSPFTSTEPTHAGFVAGLSVPGPHQDEDEVELPVLEGIEGEEVLDSDDDDDEIPDEKDMFAGSRYDPSFLDEEEDEFFNGLDADDQSDPTPQDPPTAHTEEATGEDSHQEDEGPDPRLEPNYPGAPPSGWQRHYIEPTREPLLTGYKDQVDAVDYLNFHGAKVKAVDSGSRYAARGKTHSLRGVALEATRVRTTRVGVPMKIVSRDLLWIRQVVRYGYLSYEELNANAQVLGFPKTTLAGTRERVRKLLSAGVFDAWSVPSSGVGGHLVTPTRKSLKHHGLGDYIIRQPNPIDVLHTSAIARLGLYLESLDPNYDQYYVFTESEIFTLKKTGEAPLLQLGTEHWGDKTPDISDRYRFITPRDGGFTWAPSRVPGHEWVRGGYFQPDLVLLRPDQGPIAIEVERVAKSDLSVYEEKFASYVASDNFAGIQYVCFSKAVAGVVRKAVSLVPGAAEKIAVEVFPDTLMPIPPIRIERITAQRIRKSRDRRKAALAAEREAAEAAQASDFSEADSGE